MQQFALRNPALYTALTEVFGHVRVSSGGDPGAYTYPPQAKVGLLRTRTSRPLGKVTNWGETYHVNCPICKDTKQRLYISHYTGASAFAKKTKDKNTGLMKPSSALDFGIIAVCHNERCNITHLLSKLVVKAGKMTDVITHAPSAYSGGLIENVPLPQSYSLLDTCVPTHVLDYLASRRYSPEELTKTFDIRYMPPNTYLWTTEDERDVHSWDHRLLIPVTRARRIIGWQARIAEASTDKKIKKYIFPPVRCTGGQGKSHWFYNGYQASWYSDLVLVEGVTDVWRVGPNALSIFGKTASNEQLRILHRVWGYHASCVIVLDGDAWKDAVKLLDLFREHKTFKYGVAAVRLPDGVDPDDYSTEEINAIIADARLTCQ